MGTCSSFKNTVDDDRPGSNKFNMSPSEIHEFKDFEKAMAGEIYAEKKQQPVRRNSPSPKGMDKFRPIPSLASEKRINNVRTNSDLSTASSTPTSSPRNKDKVNANRPSDRPCVDESAFGTHCPLPSNSFDGDAPLKPITAISSKTYVKSRFTSNQNEQYQSSHQEVEDFSIANDEAAL